MPEEKNSGKVLAMYDIRGIQNFIFRTNKVKEIMGASRLVENIILEALDDSLKKTDLTESEYICRWEDNEEFRILSDDSIAAQVLFIGGGNAYVMYRDKALAVAVNKKMARYVLDETYSLQLAVAMVDKSDSYSEDYQALQNEMARIKACMPYSCCMGAIPVVAVDDMTGFPYNRLDGEDELKKKLGKHPEYREKIEKEGLSYESIRKLTTYYDGFHEGEEKDLDNLITEYGRESMLAVVHIDGNNMGMRIRSLMKDETDYTRAVKKMRDISRNINLSYKETFENTVEYIQRWVESPYNDVLKKEEDGQKAQYVRKILVAGDDITFVCNARLALPMVKYFVQDISGKVMSGKSTEDSNIEEYGFSVCAGIAYMHSHFPFGSAYEVAEECCSSAKERAKDKKNKIVSDNLERIGNWVDFQICRSVHNIDLEKSRKKNYELSEREWLLRRPYYIKVDWSSYSEMKERKERPYVESAYAELNKRNEKYSYQIFERVMEYFKYNADMPRSLAKDFRNAYPLGKSALEELIEFAHSRKKLGEDIREETLSGTEEDFGFVELDGKNTAAWYDALEMMDYYVKIKQEGDGGKEAQS